MCSFPIRAQAFLVDSKRIKEQYVLSVVQKAPSGVHAGDDPSPEVADPDQTRSMSTPREAWLPQPAQQGFAVSLLPGRPPIAIKMAMDWANVSVRKTIVRICGV